MENPLHHVSSSAMSSLWPPPQFQWLAWIWKMNMGQLLRLRQIQQETGLSTMKSPLQREYGQIWIGWRHFHPWEISWPLFYVLGHKDQVKGYNNNLYKGKWWSIILHNSSPDIYHHSPSIQATQQSSQDTSIDVQSLGFLFALSW